MNKSICMGRKYVIKKEPSTTTSLYVIDSSILDDYTKPGETKPDALRRIFVAFFGEDVIKQKRREIQKKLDRQNLINGSLGDQSRLDNMYFPQKTIKDLEYEPLELMEIIKEAKRLKGELADRNAADSIQKAVNRGDAIINEGTKTVTILR